MKTAIAAIVLALFSVVGVSAQVNPNAPFPFTAPIPAASSSVNADICSKTIGFAVISDEKVNQFMPGWVQNWVKKNAKKHPDVCFSEMPGPGENYLIVLSNTSLQSSGFMPTIRTDITPISGSGTVTTANGSNWDFTYSGTVTTTTRYNAAYMDTNNYLYATAYDSRGEMRSQRYHLYSSRAGGDAYNTLGYNLGGMFAAINARGSLINSVVKDIAPKAKKVKKAKNSK